jgi:methylated-DNA-[protein]-cysteine S-methyltransferase
MSDRAQIWFSRLEKTPLGPVWVAVTLVGLAAVRLGGEEAAFCADLARRFKAELQPDAQRATVALEEIQEYLHGTRQSFSLPVDWTGMTAFQKEVLLETRRVPYGTTISYGELAHRIGRPRAARAVGRAEATNPIPLVLPCHRIIGSDGSLRGYAGPQGIETKAWLLKMEQNQGK